MSSGQTEFKLNHFADLTPAEFKSKILMKPAKSTDFNFPANKYFLN